MEKRFMGSPGGESRCLRRDWGGDIRESAGGFWCGWGGLGRRKGRALAWGLSPNSARHCSPPPNVGRNAIETSPKGPPKAAKGAGYRTHRRSPTFVECAKRGSGVPLDSPTGLRPVEAFGQDARRPDGLEAHPTARHRFHGRSAPGPRLNGPCQSGEGRKVSHPSPLFFSLIRENRGIRVSSSLLFPLIRISFTLSALRVAGGA